MKHLIIAATLCAASLISWGSTQAQLVTAPAASPASGYPVEPAPGLYQALGEKAGLRTLMDDVVQRASTDPRIGERFKKTKLDELSKQLTDQFCQLAGGPCVYKGPTMKDSHADMEITRADFNTLVEVLRQAMNAQDIPFPRQNQLLALVAPMYRDVVLSR